MCRTRWQPCCFNKLSSPLSHFLIITSCVRRAKHRCTLDEHTHTLHFQPPPPPVKVVEVLVGCQQFPFLQAKHQGLSNTHTQTRQEAQMPHWSMDQSRHCSRLQAIYSMCLSTHAHMYTQSTVLLCASEQGKKIQSQSPFAPPEQSKAGKSGRGRKRKNICSPCSRNNIQMVAEREMFP